MIIIRLIHDSFVIQLMKELLVGREDGTWILCEFLFFFFFLSFYASLKEERHDEARLRCNYGPFQAHASDGGKSGSPTAMLLGWDKGQFLGTVMTVNKFIPFRLYNKLILGLGR